MKITVFKSTLVLPLLMAAGCSGSSPAGTTSAVTTAVATVAAATTGSGTSKSSTGSSGTTGLVQCMGQLCSSSNDCCAGAYCFEGSCYENGVQPTTGSSSGNSQGSLASSTGSTGSSASASGGSGDSFSASASASNAVSSASASATGMSSTGGSRTSSTGGKTSGKSSSGTTGNAFSLGAGNSTHLPEDQEEFFNVIIFPPIGSKADGHVFVPGVQPNDGPVGWVHDINISTHTDRKSDVPTSAPFGGAYVDDQLSLCDITPNSGWDSKVATYDSSLGASTPVDFGMCVGELAIPNTTTIAIAPVGQTDGAKGLGYLNFVDGSNNFVNLVTADELFGVAPPVLPAWIAPSQDGTKVVTSGPGGGNLPDAGGTLLLTDVATGEISKVASYDGGLFTSVAISPDASTVYATYLQITTVGTKTTETNLLNEYQVSTSKRLKSITMDGYVYAASLSPDGSILALLMSIDDQNSSGAPFVECYRTSDMTKQSTTAVTENDTPLALGFAPDFNHLVVIEQYHYEIFPVRH